MGAAPARSWLVDGDADEFVVEFCSVPGERSRLGLLECAGLEVERFAPVRSFSSYRGQSAFGGSWWFATTGEHVGHESWLERDNLIALDFDPDVVGVASQPFWLHWAESGRDRRHAPDYFVRLRDGAGLVVDVRADGRIEPEDAAVFAVTEQACKLVGWGYRRVGEQDSMLTANLRWLAGYRHRRCLRPGLVAELERAFAVPVELGRGVAVVGDPIVVLPTVFHLMWLQRLTADLMSAVLSWSTLVGVE